MNVLTKAIVLIIASRAAVFCQNAPTQDPRQQLHEPLTYGMPKGGSHSSANLLHIDSCVATQNACARSVLFHPFSYTLSQDHRDYFPVKFGPVRYTFWPRTSQFERPAGGRFQNLVDEVLRHYTSHPVVPVNDRCVRSLSCNSLYEQAVRRRAVTTTAIYARQ